jgi:hypothetical protein
MDDIKMEIKVEVSSQKCEEVFGRKTYIKEHMENDEMF